ncbi:MAG: polysaccharide ABC transporter ATP-binding protein [Bacteroidota bacterium]
MSHVVIRAENVSKRYRLGAIGTGSLVSEWNRYWARKKGKEDPFSKIKVGGHVKPAEVADINEFWALRDVSFDIKSGEAIGIIGKNGAGKSTLLKILSRVTLPTSGSIKVRGRIASLLEVGTGFHPDLSGRENIFLNGAILGMTKNEIVRKFDEIVDFSGVERFIDTPVKRYSSGMYVRLAFAVAAHLDPEILIVDEVLAVGDADFQKKCLGKMGEVAGQGRTVLFVSHQLAAVRALCNRAIVMEKGTMKFTGDIEKGIEKYLENKGQIGAGLSIADRKRDSNLSLIAKIIDFRIITPDGVNPEFLDATMPFQAVFTIQSYEEGARVGTQFIIADDIQNLVLIDSGSVHGKIYKLPMGVSEVSCVVAPTFLAKGDYHIDLVLQLHNQEGIDRVTEAYRFTVPYMDPYKSGYNIDKNHRIGLFHVDHQWDDAMHLGSI